MVGPSDPRTHVFACPVAALKRLPFARPSCALPLQSALWLGHRTASRCRCLQVVLRVDECADALVAGPGSSSSNGASFRRVLGAQPMLLHTATQHQTEEIRITRMQKGTMDKGRPPFCHHQCNAHRGTSACCASTMQCPVNQPASHDLEKIQDSFAT